MKRPMKDFGLLLARSGILVKITDSYSYKIVPMKKINLLFLYIASSETFFSVVQPEVAVCRGSASTKKVYFKFSQNSQENTCRSQHMLGKHMAWGLQLHSKWNSDTGVFLWILWSFKEQRFYRKTLGDCFCQVKQMIKPLSLMRYKKENLLSFFLFLSPTIITITIWNKTCK